MGAKQLLGISSLILLALIAGSLQGCKKPAPPDAGAVQITIKPATAAYELGGKWMFDGGAPNDSGAILQNILVGTHTVTFTDIAQWETPTPQNVLILKDQTTSLEATYYKQFTLTTSVLGNGVMVPAQGVHVYRENEQVTLAATPRPGWAFDHWEGDLGSEEPAETLLMNADKTVTAVFVQLPSYTLTIDIEGAGTTVPGEGVHVYNEGDPVSIVATPATGWHFDHWSGALTGTQFNGQLTMNGNLQVTAHFARDQVTYTLNVSAQPGAGGTVALLPAGGEYPSGSSVVASATPAQYYRFTGWTGGITSADNPVSIEMNQDRAIVANFVYEPPQFTLDTWVQPSTGGAVTLNPQQPEGGYLWAPRSRSPLCP